MEAPEDSARSLRVQLAPQAAPGNASRSERFSYEPPLRTTYPPVVEFLRRHAFSAFIFAVFLGTAVLLGVEYEKISHNDSGHGHADFIRLAKLLSVPLVCLLFTWFHVWLALQMMFFPIDFVGIPSRPIVPSWFGLPINGWQGIVPRKAEVMARRACDRMIRNIVTIEEFMDRIVPRKAEVMARRACDRMIGNIVTIEEFMDRIEPKHFFDTLEELMGGLCFQVLEKIMLKHLPTVWQILPEAVQLELKTKVLEDTKASFGDAMMELRGNISSILDLQQMSVDTFVNNPRMMVEMFRSVAVNELTFIQRIAAFMGFLLGLVQVLVYLLLENVAGMDYIMLPVSGLIIGYFTNWIAIKMIFRPVWPHQYCNGRINVQGVFMKRQREASQKMAELICKNVVDARAMLHYMMRSPSSTGVDKVLAIYRKHVDRSVERSMSFASRVAVVAPRIEAQMDELKQDVEDFSLELLPQHSRAIEEYMDTAMNVQETLTWRLQRIPPPEFESIVHPIFQDDEWILLLVGGILGVLIGLLQAYALQHIH